MSGLGHSRRSTHVCAMSAHPLTAAIFASQASVAISLSALTRMRLNRRADDIASLRVAFNAPMRLFRHE